MEIFRNKKIYIAPKTPISVAFKEYLAQALDFEFLGFLDKVKEDNDVSKVEQIIEKEFDYIVIISPNHYKMIYSDYLKLINKNKISVILIEHNKYNILKKVVETRISKIEKYSKEIDEKCEKRKSIAFISKGFIDSNNKYLFLYLLKEKIDCYIITDNKEQIEELKEFDIPYYELESDEGDKAIARAKYLIFDQANYTYFYISPNQKTVQLWHGVGLKKMSKLTNIEYDYFISTSNWTNETNFKNVFCAKEYLDCGYPRNDIFFKDEEPIDLIFCNKEIYSLVKNKKHKKIALYMPTIREYLFNKNMNLKEFDIVPIDFIKLNEELLNEDILLIVKLHPSVMEFFKELIVNEEFSNIKFHPTQGDIYPIIKYVDVLITDYSSIAYDFLLLDRPIIFFDYDRELYEKNMGGFLFDYDEYSPGINVKTEVELIIALKFLEDCFFIKREEIKDKFFKENGLVSKTLLNRILIQSSKL